jgi:hypothetical protein
MNRTKINFYLVLKIYDFANKMHPCFLYHYYCDHNLIKIPSLTSSRLRGVGDLMKHHNESHTFDPLLWIMISKMASIVNKCFKLDLRFAWFKIMILTLIIKRGIGIRILKHDSDFELKSHLWNHLKWIITFLFHIIHVCDFPKNLKHDFANKMHPCFLYHYYCDHNLIKIPSLTSSRLRGVGDLMKHHFTDMSCRVRSEETTLQVTWPPCYRSMKMALMWQWKIKLDYLLRAMRLVEKGHNSYVSYH